MTCLGSGYTSTKLQNAVTPNFVPKTQKWGPMHFQWEYAWLSVWQFIRRHNISIKSLQGLRQYDVSLKFRRQIEFSTTPTATKLTRAIVTDNRKQRYKRFGRRYCNLWQSVVVVIISLIYCRARHHRKHRILRWNFDVICQSSTDVTISGSGCHIDISGCRSLLYSLANVIL